MSAYLVGALFAVGLILCLTSFAPVPQSLQTSLNRLGRPAITPTRSPSFVTRHFGESWIDTSFARKILAGSEADLRICNMTAAEHLAERIGFALIAALWTPVTFALMATGGVSVSFVLPLWVSVALLPIGFLYPSLTLRSKARVRRRAFRHAFSSFLDIVSVSLAGGRGVEGALHDAADAGNSWTFDALRQAMLEARLAGETPWTALDRLGTRLQLSELNELAASATLAGNEGARVRNSISAKANGLRLRGLADIEAAAQSASERMSLPIVALMLGFVLFLGYPAVMAVVQGL